MQPSRAEATATVQQVVLGQLAADAPEVQAALATFPDLGRELRDLLAVQQELDTMTDDAERIEVEARAAVTGRDELTVRQLLGMRRPAASRWLLVLAAVLVIAIAFVIWPRGHSTPTIDGKLGPATAMMVDRSGATWSVDPGMQLPPGSQYLVTLEVDGSPVEPAKPFPCPIQLSAAWQQKVDHASTAVLLVELPELGWRLRVPLR